MVRSPRLLRSKLPTRRASVGRVALATLALLPWLVAGVAGAQDASAPPSVARLLPADCLGAVVVDDVGALVRALRATDVAGLAEEPDVAALLGDIAREAAPHLARAETAIGIPFSELRQILGGQIGYAVTGVGPSKSDPFLRHQLLVVRLPSEAAAKTWRKIVARAVEALLRKVPGIELDQETIHGAKVRLLSKSGVTIRRTMTRGHLVVGTDRRAFSSALRLLAAPAGGDSRGALSALPTYEAARREATEGRPGVFAFVNTARIFEVVLPHAARKDRRNLEALGLTQIRAMGLGSTLGSHGFQDAIYVHAPDAKAGLFTLGKAFRAADLDRSFTRTPAEAVLCAALRVRPAALYAALQELWVAALPPDQVDALYAGVRELEKELGLTLAEILAPIGDQVLVYAVMPDRGEGLYPEIVFQVSLRDEAAARRNLARLVERLTRPGAERPPLDIRTLPLPPVSVAATKPRAGDGAPSASPATFWYWNLAPLTGQSPIEPAFAIRDGQLVIAMTPLHLKQALERRARPAASLAGSAALRRALRPHGRPAQALVYADLPKVLRGLYNTYGPFFQAATDKGDLPFEPGLLPTPRTLTRHLYPAVLAWESRPGGPRLHLSSPAGPLAVIVTGAALDGITKLSRQGAAQALRTGVKRPTLALPTVDLAFDGVPVAEALEVLARQSGASVFFPRAALSGRTTTCAAHAVPLDRAVETVLRGSGFRARVRQLPDGETQVVVYRQATSREEN